MLGKELGSDGIKRLDEEMWELINTLYQKHIVHFITDSKEYLYEAYRRYGKEIFYGLHWEDIQSICNGYGIRATGLAAATGSRTVVDAAFVVAVAPHQPSMLLYWVALLERCS